MKLKRWDGFSATNPSQSEEEPAYVGLNVAEPNLYQSVGNGTINRRDSARNLCQDRISTHESGDETKDGANRNTTRVLGLSLCRGLSAAAGVPIRANFLRERGCPTISDLA